MERKCIYCNKFFNDIPGRVFSNHVRWCDENPSRDNTENISKAIKESFNNRLGELKDFFVQCEKCKKTIIIKERSKLHPIRDKYYCSRSCSNSRIKTQVIKDKIRSSIIVYQQKNGIGKKEERICLHCNFSFHVIKSSLRKFCSKQCYNNNRKSLNDFASYRRECSFKFNVWHYPEEFNLDLIKKFGWYSAANRGNNFDGISRDHKISVKYGWENGISSEIMSHPANCMLMKNTENKCKQYKCSINLQELIKLIDIWNKKYKN